MMYQSWRSLLFLHWSFAPEQIQPLLPKGLELDTFGGRAYVGLVPFTMRGIRPVYLPTAPWLSAFHETNVRTYVHVEGKDPGVWFFSLDAANPIAVELARRWFHLPYYRARMSLTATASDGTIRYCSERRDPRSLRASLAIDCAPRGSLGPVPPGTLDHFLVERYYLYAAARGRLYRGQVHHKPYPVQTAEVLSVEESLLASNGLFRPVENPIVHFSPGVDVEIFPLGEINT